MVMLSIQAGMARLAKYSASEAGIHTLSTFSNAIVL
jgi:hypothetical protein